MDTINFLENLAHSAHHQINLRFMINQQSNSVQQAYLNKDEDKLKSEFSNTHYHADWVEVVNIPTTLS
jgi:hypothetical protein